MIPRSSPVGFPPGAFLVEAQKAATTTFADLLAQHPAVTPSTPKEPNFFTGRWAQGLDWYAARFASRDGVLVDASTSYSQCPLPERCHADNPLVGVPAWFTPAGSRDNHQGPCAEDGHAEERSSVKNRSSAFCTSRIF